MKPLLVRLVHAGLAAGLAVCTGFGTLAAAQGLPCDPQPGLWCDQVAAACTRQIPGPGLTDCDVRVTNEWSFNEGAYCTGCAYTFYVLVECGREMHLPLSDMEGARITVTEMLSGRPATLRCLNDAAKGNPPALLRCVGPAGKTGYGPAYDQSTSTGGTLSWGFPDCVSAADIICDDIPFGGGPVSRASPGELQTMDCSVTSPTGLCGLYRVEIESGGFEWQLFANCDGSNTPQFDIYFDCAEALAAFDPRPELALANLTASGNCPVAEASFDVQNLGCVDYIGQVPVRITTDCVPPVQLDLLVDGPVPANGAVRVLVPIDVTCDATITVTVDPDDTIVECTEASTVASCSQATGVQELQALVQCCAATLDPRGADAFGCPGQLLTLDASASTIAPCASPLYRWSDELGNVLQDWSALATFSVTPSCPGQTYSLDIACEGESCTKRTSVAAGCVEASAVGGPDASACEGARIVLDGSASTVTNCAEPEHRWRLGPTEVQPWGPSSTLVLDPFTCAQAGTYTLETRCFAAVCADADDVTVTCSPGPPPPEAQDLRVARAADAVTMTWTPTVGADGHRVLRGAVAALWIGRAYDHAADDALGAGACDAGLSGTFTDPDDGNDGNDWYYLVVPFTACGGDGPAGFGRVGATQPSRPARIPTPSCP